MKKAAPTQPIKIKEKRSGTGNMLTRLFTAGLLIGLCLVLAAVGYIISQVPAQVQRDFGPPSPALSLQQRVVYGYRLLANQDNLLTPMDPLAQPRDFDVVLGEPVVSISYRLEEQRLIANADAFRTFLIYAGLDTGIQAGRYPLSPAMSAVEIARALQDALPGAVNFNILPGWRVEEIAAALPTSGLVISADEFLALVHNPPPALYPAEVEALSSLEGFLMPGSYRFERDTDAENLLAVFVQRFDETLTPDLRQAFGAQGLSVVEAVTLASIIQREAVVEVEQPLIASVFYNRLANGMRLESDPTVQYALGFQPDQITWWKNPVLLDDLRVDSAYNTYVYSGLPVGPICSPGASALRAVAYPAQTGYFYFRAQCDGSGKHEFAVTFDEHLRNACP